MCTASINIISTPPHFTAEQLDNSKRRVSIVSLDSMDLGYEKRVHFADTVSVSSSPSPLDQLQVEDNITSYSDLWYQLGDLAMFRDEARLLCREMRRLDEQEPTYNPRLLCLSRHEQTRGLEQRSCLERQRRKYLAIRFIVKASHKADSEEQLAEASRRITAWAAELAVAEAKRDYVRAYYCEHASSTANKRPSIVSIEEEQRRVRPRLLVSQ